MRKKLLFAALAALLCVPLAKADDPILLPFAWDELPVIPAEFTPDGKDVVCDWDDETYYGVKEEVKLYNSNFELVKQFDAKRATIPSSMGDTEGALGFSLYISNNIHCGYSCLVAGVFSKDFVYCLPILSIPYYNGNYHLVSKGISILDLSGEEISRIDFPDGYYDRRRRPSIHSMNNKKYLVVPVEDELERGYSLIYEMDGTSAGIKQVAMMPVSKVSPTAPHRGEKVTVTLDEEMTAQGAEVRVVGSDGQVMMNSKIAVGQTTLDIPTNRLKQGVYVVTVGDKEATKIVIR